MGSERNAARSLLNRGAPQTTTSKIFWSWYSSPTLVPFRSVAAARLTAPGVRPNRRAASDARAELQALLGKNRKPLGERPIGPRGSRFARQPEPVLHEILGDHIEPEPRHRHPSRPLPEELNGKAQRGFELLGPPREEKREHRIAKQPGFGEIRSGEAKRGQVRLKPRVVPERRGDSFVLAEAVLERDAGRKLSPRACRGGGWKRVAGAVFQGAGDAFTGAGVAAGAAPESQDNHTKYEPGRSLQDCLFPSRPRRMLP